MMAEAFLVIEKKKKEKQELASYCKETDFNKRWKYLNIKYFNGWRSFKENYHP